MLDLGLLDTPMFSLWLNPDVSEVAAGEIRFGGASVDRQDGPLVELPVVSDKCAPGCGPAAAARPHVTLSQRQHVRMHRLSCRRSTSLACKSASNQGKPVVRPPHRPAMLAAQGRRRADAASGGRGAGGGGWVGTPNRVQAALGLTSARRRRGRYWMLAMGAASVGSARVQLSARAAILDTGTTLITCSDVDSRSINTVRRPARSPALGCEVRSRGAHGGGGMRSAGRRTCARARPVPSLRRRVCARAHRRSRTRACACAQRLPGVTYQPDAKLWRVDAGCDAVDGLPNVTFVLGGHAFTLSPRQYVVQARARGARPAPAGRMTGGRGSVLVCRDSAGRCRRGAAPPASRAACQPAPHSLRGAQIGAGAGRFCMSGIVGGGAVGSKVVLGETFLRAYYSTYRQQNAPGKGRPGAFIGLAPAAASAPADAGPDAGPDAGAPRRPNPLARDGYSEAAPVAPPAGVAVQRAAPARPTPSPSAGIAAAAAWTEDAGDSLPAASASANRAVAQLPGAAGAGAAAAVDPGRQSPAALGTRVTGASSYMAAHGGGLDAGSAAGGAGAAGKQGSEEGSAGAPPAAAPPAAAPPAAQAGGGLAARSGPTPRAGR